MRQKLVALWPTAMPDSVDILARMLVQLVDGQLSAKQFADQMQGQAIQAQWRGLLAGKSIGNQEHIYAFDDNIQPWQIDAKYTQGFSYRPTGPVIQFFNESVTPPPTPKIPRVLLCFDVEDQAILPIIDAIKAQLSNCDIFSIPRSIESKRSWRDDLYMITSICDAAVILLSEGVLRSKIIVQALCLLNSRVLVSKLSPPILLSVLLNPLTSEHLSKSQIPPYVISRLDMLQTNELATILRELDKRLTLLKDTFEKDDRPRRSLEVAGQKIAESFSKELYISDLNTFASNLLGFYFEPSTWATPRIQFAWALWNTHPSCINALKNITEFNGTFDKEAINKLLNKIEPGWIDPWAACRIPQAVMDQRAICVNAKDTKIAKTYVRRAYWSVLDHGKSAEVVNADTGNLESLANEVRLGLAKTWKYRSIPDDTQLDRDIQNQTKYSPVFVIICGLPSVEIVNDLVKIAAFQHATFFFVPEDVVTPEQMAAYGDAIIFLEPLDYGLEAETHGVYEYP